MKTAVKVLNLTLAVLLVGLMLAIWLGLNPVDPAGPDYVRRQQAMIRALNTPMPLLGAATIVLTLVSAFLRRAQRGACLALVTAAVLIAGAGLVTRFCNQPINAIVMTWNPAAPPADWEVLRDQWWHWHQARALLGSAGLALLLFGHFRRVLPEKFPG